MIIENVTNRLVIPAAMKEKLSGKSIEQQLEYFSLELCYDITCWLDGREIKHPEKYHGEKNDFADKYKILVQDNIIIGVDVGEELYCFKNPCSSIYSYNGHRTSSDGWGYEEEHKWFVFRYIGDGENA